MMTQALREPSDPGSTERRTRRLKLTGYALAIWSFAYALPHLYWALGGRMGMIAIHPAAPDLPQWRQINWVATIGFSALSLLGLAFRPLANGRIGRPIILLIALIGCSLAVSHAFYGIGSRTLTVIRAFARSQDVPVFVLVDLLIFEPWFLIQGMLLGLCGWFSLASTKGRRRWLAACAGATLVALAAALLNLRIY
ncbi:DUF3995 domain-containing protein [Sphingosinicella rhizophila]|uniref:DUF3995 domain-containing protein n=1 Tax=Sphingosinicella rhizophila TaxID=3050082 RepID=A0ABU3Q4Z5_9SPHN|nr:DUF3995 domain-containing protein [Sphingosinicella sp. GR2756]MDT9598490.1 DUF3995 domain-containing protein [Sphingosinicella sp. GR2756]